MNSLQKALLPLRLVGLRNGLRSVLYAARRDRLDARYRATGQDGASLRPGRLFGGEATPGGARFRFEQYELNVRFLASNLVRVVWGVGPAASYAVEKTEWPETGSHLRRQPGGWTVQGSVLRLRVGTDAALTFSGVDGGVLREEAPPEQYGQGSWTHRARLQPEACVYGLGERANGLNLRPGSYRMWNRDVGGTYGPGDDPLYTCMPVYLCVHAAGSYLIFYDNSYDGHVRLDEEAEASFEGGALCYYIISGTLAEILERFTELTGRAPLPPRWALGYHISRWLAPPWTIGRLPAWHTARPGYDHMSELRKMTDGFQHHGLPLGVVHLDNFHWRDYRIFDIDQRRLPEITSFIRELNERGVRVATILQGSVKRDDTYDIFADGKRRDVFCKQPDGRTIFAPLWAGWTAYPDFTDPQVRAWWKPHYQRLLEVGLDGFWHDMNEPSAFAAWGDFTLPRSTRHALDGRGGDHREGHNLFGLLMNRAGYEGLRELRPERRPWLLSRSGWVGLQRHAWNWTGDIESSWEMLRQTIGTVVGLGVCGVPYSGSDIGGFSEAPSTELYLRWFQMNAFLPFFRTHSAFYLPRREPWEFGHEALGIIRRYLELRYRLLPYLYTLAWEASRTGAPLVRPLFWNEPENPALWKVEDAFLLGGDLVVAPVVEEGARRRTLRLPRGGWYRLSDDAYFDGSRKVDLDAPLEHIPVLVRAGTVLPMQEGERLTLHVYPPRDTGVRGGQLYNDAGDGYGSYSLDRFRLKRFDGGFDLTRTSEGDFPKRHGRIELRLHGFSATRVIVDGLEIEHENERLIVGEFRTVRFLL